MQEPSGTRKRAVQVHLYICAVVSNVIALAILLYGLLLEHSRPRQKTLVIVMTAISVFTWTLFFGLGNRRRT
jgi:uncharacterized oligopeptide transporter (OPT) family protein